MDNQYRISEEEYAALCRHPEEVRKLVRRLKVLDREVDVIGPEKLIRDREMISRLKKAGNYHRSCGRQTIWVEDSDTLSGEEKMIKYGILTYAEIAILLDRDPDSMVPLSSLDVRKACGLKKGIRCADAGEALLLPAVDHRIGHDRIYIAVIRNTDRIVCVSYDKNLSERRLTVFSYWSSHDEYGAECDFFFVIE